MKNNNKWFSLVIAMLLVIILTLLALTILEYIIPFSRDIKWIENSSKAYYQANSWIEDWLYKIYGRNYWWWDTRVEYNENIAYWSIGRIFTTTSSWKTLPPAWEWNSDYDKDRYIIYSWNPVQLLIWNWNFNNVADSFNINFRVPDLDKNWSFDETLKWGPLPIINWQLSSSSNTLNSSWSIFTANDIDWTDNNMKILQWVDLNWNETNNQKFWKFYEDNCWVWSWCTLKLSVVNKLQTDEGPNSIIIPYLEWYIKVWNSIIPLRYTKLATSWKAFWFKKDINVRIPSQTVNEAFDFTVFQ